MTLSARALRVAGIAAVGVFAAAGLVSLARTPRAGGQQGALGKPERVIPGVREPSGVAFDPRRGHLFVVGDEGSLVEITLEGKLVRSFPMAGDLEDVAVHPPSGDLLLLFERESELLLFDPEKKAEKRRWKLPRAVLLGAEPSEKNSGFEGLTFQEDSGRPGGGIVVMTHQRTPPMVVALSFDLARPAGPLEADTVLWRKSVSEDLTAITWSPELKRFLAIAEKKDRLLVLQQDGSLEDEIPLPGLRQEGLAFDGNGALWVADDEGRVLLKFPSARQSLESRPRR
jgi:uncharacterized protein YjiK